MAANFVDDPPYSLSICQGTIKVFWTNLTDKDVTFTLPTKNSNTDKLVVPRGVCVSVFVPLVLLQSHTISVQWNFMQTVQTQY